MCSLRFLGLEKFEPQKMQKAHRLTMACLSPNRERQTHDLVENRTISSPGPLYTWNMTFLLVRFGTAVDGTRQTSVLSVIPEATTDDYATPLYCRTIVSSRFSITRAARAQAARSAVPPSPRIVSGSNSPAFSRARCCVR